MKALRPYQEDTLAAIRASVGQGVRRLMVQAPTGAGKTLLAAYIAHGAQSKGNPLVFVVDSISLIDQTVQAFYDEGITEVGVIQADHPLTDWSKPIQVASIETIRSRKQYPKAAVVIIDEAHRLHKEHIKWMGRIGDKEKGEPKIVDAAPGWEAVPFIGLSATPWTKGLGRYFESLLVMNTTKELIKLGYLSPFRTFAADHPDLSDVKTVRGDYHEGQLSTVMQEKALVANIVETWKTKWGKDKTLLFGVDCAHAKMLQQRFHDAGVSCAYQDAHTPMAERATIRRGFHNGQCRVVANVGTLTTGVDWDVRCLVLARPTKSEMLFVQIIGRALRTAEGKDRALILDHTDTTSRLGFVTDIHRDELDDGKLDNKKSKRSAPLPKNCPQCDCLMPPRIMTCPSCGHERKIESKVFERDGELVELNGERRRPVVAHLYTMDEKARFYAQLKGYGRMKGYKEGWAGNQYREKFKAWPDWSIKHVAPMAPGPEVSRWIKSRLIAYFKHKHNAERRQAPLL